MAPSLRPSFAGQGSVTRPRRTRQQFLSPHPHQDPHLATTRIGHTRHRYHGRTIYTSRSKNTKRDGLIGFERGQRLVNYCGSPCGISFVSAAAAGTVEWRREPQYYNFGGLLWSRRIASASHKTICVYMQRCSANYLNWGQAQCMFGCVYSNCSAARHMCSVGGASAVARRPL